MIYINMNGRQAAGEKVLSGEGKVLSGEGQVRHLTVKAGRRGKKFLSSLKISQKCRPTRERLESSDLDCAKRFYFDTYTTAQKCVFLFSMYIVLTRGQALL